MVIIVGPSVVSVEELVDLSVLPSVDSLRPAACAGCRQVSRPLGQALGIVGHGTYTRQVLGLDPDGTLRPVVIWIRRYLCRGCARTISVLPDVLYPGRWYAVAAMLVSLFLSLCQGRPAGEVRERVGGSGGACDSTGWRTLQRWQGQLLRPLWSWLAPQIGLAHPPAGDRRDWRHRLMRLLSLQGAGRPGDLGDVAVVAHALMRDTVHDVRSGRSHRRDR